MPSSLDLERSGRYGTLNPNQGIEEQLGVTPTEPRDIGNIWDETPPVEEDAPTSPDLPPPSTGFKFSDVQGTEKYRTSPPVTQRRMAEKFFTDYVEKGAEAASLDVDEVKKAFYGKYGIDRLEADGVDTALHGLQLGIEESFTSNLALEAEARFPMGRLFTTDEEGSFQLWQSADDLIPGFSDMDVDQRKKAIRKARKAHIDEMNPLANEDALAHSMSRFAGWLVDPTTAIPIGGAALGGVKGVGAAASTGGLLAGADAAAYTNAEEGSINWETVAVAGLIGATGAGVIRKGGQYLAANKADKQLNEFTYQMSKNRAAMADVPAYSRYFKEEELGYKAFKKTLNDYGMNELDMQKITGEGRLPVRFFPNANEAQKYADARSKELFGRHKAPKKSTIREGIRNAIEPLSDGIRKIDPKLAHVMRNAEGDLLETIHEDALRLDPFIRKLSRTSLFNKAAHDEIWEAMANGSQKRVFQLGKEFGFNKVDIQEARDVLDKLYKMEQGAGREFGYLKGYFPRELKDAEKLKKHLGPGDQSRLDKIMAKELTKAQKKTPSISSLSKAEEDKIAMNYLMGMYDAKGNIVKPGFIEKRKVPYLTKEALRDAYIEPSVTLHRYIVKAHEDLYRRQILGKEIVNAAGDDIDKSVVDFINAKYVKSLPREEQERLAYLLQARFGAINHTPNRLVRTAKNLGYAALLGNPWSAMTQIGDVFLGSYRNGFVNTMQGIFTPESKLAKGLTPKELGLVHDLAQEFVSHPDGSKKILEWSFKLGGFKASDRLGKRAILRGAFVKYMKQAQTLDGVAKLRKDWGHIYGDEFIPLLNDLKAGKVTARTKSLAMHELMDLQPVTQLEMPALYLKHPQYGRLMYMLKTFSLKHLNLIRKDIAENWRKGNRTEAIKNATALTAFFSTGTFVSSEGKAALSYLLSGDSDKWNDHTSRFMDALLSNTVFLNRYQTQQFQQEPTETIAKFFLPPVNLLDPWIRGGMDMATGDDIASRDQKGIAKSIPIIGKFVKELQYGGIEETLDIGIDGELK